MNIFYVYQFLREDKTPYYIGKGKDNRAWTHSSWERIHSPKDRSKIEIVKSNLTESEAHSLETTLIRQYGRIDIGTGILRNISDGGEGAAGCVRSEETKLKISKKNKGKIPWNKGIKTPGIGGVKKGNIPWNKGVLGQSKSEEYKMQQSIRMAEWWKTRKEQKNG